jgi:hypothetical protein
MGLLPAMAIAAGRLRGLMRADRFSVGSNVGRIHS